MEAPHRPLEAPHRPLEGRVGEGEPPRAEGGGSSALEARTTAWPTWDGLDSCRGLRHGPKVAACRKFGGSGNRPQPPNSTSLRPVTVAERNGPDRTGRSASPVGEPTRAGTGRYPNGVGCVQRKTGVRNHLAKMGATLGATAMDRRHPVATVLDRRPRPGRRSRTVVDRPGPNFAEREGFHKTPAQYG
jgi:hypothetical protein